MRQIKLFFVKEPTRIKSVSVQVVKHPDLFEPVTINTKYTQLQ